MLPQIKVETRNSSTIASKKEQSRSKAKEAAMATQKINPIAGWDELGFADKHAFNAF